MLLILIPILLWGGYCRARGGRQWEEHETGAGGGGYGGGRRGGIFIHYLSGGTNFLFEYCSRYLVYYHHY